MEVATIITTATTTTPVAEGKDKLMGMIQILAFLDYLVVATMAVTVGGGRDDRLQERTVLVSGSLVWKTSWEEEEEITAAVTVDTTRGDTIKGTIKDTIREEVVTIRVTRVDTIRDTIKEDTIRTVVSATTS